MQFPKPILIGLVASGLSLACAGPANPEPTAAAAPRGGHDHGVVDHRHVYERARPVFEKYCAECHTSATGSAEALEHFSMDRYPFGGHHSDTIAETIRGALGVSGQLPTMPEDNPGVVQGEELQLVLEWADAFDRGNAAVHPPGGGHHDESGAHEPHHH